jgi:hypothetical protein
VKSLLALNQISCPLYAARPLRGWYLMRWLTDSKDYPRVSQPQNIDSPKCTEPQTQQSSSGKERTRMSTKWLDRHSAAKNKMLPTEMPLA